MLLISLCRVMHPNNNHTLLQPVVPQRSSHYCCSTVLHSNLNFNKEQHGAQILILDVVKITCSETTINDTDTAKYRANNASHQDACREPLYTGCTHIFYFLWYCAVCFTNIVKHDRNPLRQACELWPPKHWRALLDRSVPISRQMATSVTCQSRTGDTFTETLTCKNGTIQT